MAYGAKTGGRKKGSVNKVTKGAVANIMEVFDMLGGNKGFAEWAMENKTEFYRHYSKLLPLQISGDPDAPLQVNIIRYADDNTTK